MTCPAPWCRSSTRNTVKTKNPGPLVPIVEHNRQDLISLARLFSQFCEECNNGSR